MSFSIAEEVPGPRVSGRAARRTFEKVNAWCLLAKRLSECQEQARYLQANLAELRRRPSESFLDNGLGKRKSGYLLKQAAVARQRRLHEKAKRKLAMLKKEWDARGP